MQELEGTNDIIQETSKRAPHAEMPVIDARVATKKELGLGSREMQDAKWSTVAPRYEAVMNTALQYSGQLAQDVLATASDRFKTPGPSQCLSFSPTIVKGVPLSHETLVWAASYSLQWQRDVNALGAERTSKAAILIEGDVDQDNQQLAWLHVLTYRCCPHFLRCSFTATGRLKCDGIRMSGPDLFARHVRLTFARCA